MPLYYGKDESLVLHILDAVAGAEKPLSAEAIRKAVSARTPFDDIEHLRKLLRLLQQDHYLDRDAKGHYAFRFALIRRWWRLDRDL